MVHFIGIDPDAVEVIRRAVFKHVHNERAEIEVTRDVVDALTEAGFTVLKIENVDGAQ